MSRVRVLAASAVFATLATACAGGTGEPLVQARPATTTSTTTVAPDEPVERERVSIDDLDAGMCSDTDDIDTSGGFLTIIECSEPHRYEVFAVVAAAGITRTDGTVTSTAQETCEELFRLETGITAVGSLIQVIAFTSPTTGSAICLYEAPDQRVDFFARAPLEIRSIQVDRSQLDGPSTVDFAVATDVASDDSTIVVLGRTDRTDPDGLDAIVWRSINGGGSFAAVSATSFGGTGTGEVAESIVKIDSGYLAVGTRYDAAPDPQPWAVIADGGGAAWLPLDVPLAGNAGAELRSAVTRPDGTVEVIGSLYDRRGLRRPAVWTWAGFALTPPTVLVDEIVEPDANYFVESAFADETGVTIQVTDLFANRRRGFFSETAGEWTTIGTIPTLQFTTATVTDATFAIRGGALNERSPGTQDWVRVELPGHDGAIPEPIAVTTDGAGVLAVGTMASVQGTTTAFWFRPPGGPFELIYFDVDQANRIDAPTAAAPVDGGFLVVGGEDPESDGAIAPVIWLVESP